MGNFVIFTSYSNTLLAFNHLIKFHLNKLYDANVEWQESIMFVRKNRRIIKRISTKH